MSQTTENLRAAIRSGRLDPYNYRKAVIALYLLERAEEKMDGEIIEVTQEIPDA